MQENKVHTAPLFSIKERLEMQARFAQAALMGLIASSPGQPHNSGQREIFIRVAVQYGVEAQEALLAE